MIRRRRESIRGTRLFSTTVSFIVEKSSPKLR